MSSGQLDEFAALDYNQKVAIDDLCDEFEAEFESGQPPEARSYLQRSNKAVWPILIRELLSIEIAHHTESKDAIVDQYLDLFPELHEAIRSCVPSTVIEPGLQLGDFRIERQIGSGGMGIVYEAEDTKLDRRVALKFLTAEFTSDCARLDRFQREAKILAGLNHPNIATLYGFDEYENRPFCVLEFVPGLMLAERLQRGRVSVRETINIFTQIASALEAAHESGVIHRDLKPANIKITDEGMVKVLDFGLATSVSVKSESRKATSDGGDHTNSRTQLSPNVHQHSHSRATGFAGTLPYMSPEQVSGGTVDKRSDIWSFGCCLFETLTGKRAFCSQDTTELLDSIRNLEPDWRAISNEVPARLLQLVRRCLRKDARERLRDIGDARIELLDCEQDAAADRDYANPTSRRWKWAAATGFISTLLFAGLVLRGFVAPVGQEPVAQTAMSVNLPDGLQIHDDSLAMSPDGSSIAFAATDENGMRYLYVRLRYDFEIRKLVDTEGGMNPFFSPDGQRIGYIGSNCDTINVVSFSGGIATPVCRTVGPIHGGCWCQDGKLRFSSRWGATLEEINPDGSEHKQVNSIHARYVQQLSDSDMLLFRNGVVWSTSTETELVDLTDDRVDAVRYVKDHLVYSQGGSLFSVAVELDPLQKVGRPNLLIETEFDWLNFDVSESGDIVVMQGRPRDAELVWRKSGNKLEEPAWDGARRYGALQLSPDGTKLATGIKTDDRWTVWVYDFRTNTGSILTRKGESSRPVWTPDGKRIIFRWWHSGRSGLAWKGVGSREAPTWLIFDPSTVSSRSGARATFLRDGKTKLLYNGSSGNQHSKRGIVEYDLHDQSSRVLIATKNHSEAFGELSPDGKWLLYLSDHDTTRYELYITDYPGLRRTHRISQHGAIDPIWSDSSDVVYYRSLERDGHGKASGKIIAATLQFDPFSVEHETILSGTRDCPGYSFDYDAANDRFLVLKPIEASPPRKEIRWLQNALRDMSNR